MLIFIRYNPFIKPSALPFSAPVRFEQADRKPRLIIPAVCGRIERIIAVNQNVLFFLPFRAQLSALISSFPLCLSVPFAAVAHSSSP
jgi:hypothetical protein